MENRRKMSRHNKLFYQGKVTYEMGINKASDKSDDELRKTANGLVIP